MYVYPFACTYICTHVWFVQCLRVAALRVQCRGTAKKKIVFVTGQVESRERVPDPRQIPAALQDRRNYRLPYVTDSPFGFVSYRKKWFFLPRVHVPDIDFYDVRDPTAVILPVGYRFLYVCVRIDYFFFVVLAEILFRILQRLVTVLNKKKKKRTKYRWPFDSGSYGLVSLALNDDWPQLTVYDVGNIISLKMMTVQFLTG